VFDEEKTQQNSEEKKAADLKFQKKEIVADRRTRYKVEVVVLTYRSEQEEEERGRD